MIPKISSGMFPGVTPCSAVTPRDYPGFVLCILLKILSGIPPGLHSKVSLRISLETSIKNHKKKSGIPIGIPLRNPKENFLTSPKQVFVRFTYY